MSLNQPEAAERKRWFNSLSVRVAILLSLALLPLGLLGVLQNRDLTREVRSRSELSLLALTENAAASERQMIERGIGAAEALGAVLRMIRERPEECITYLQDYLQSTDGFSYVGFVPPSGMVKCASNRQFVDFSADPLFTSLIEDPRQVAAPLADTWDPSGSDVIVYDPIVENGNLLGFTVISVKTGGRPEHRALGDQRRLLSLLTINADGEVLTRQSWGGDPQAETPPNRNLGLLAGAEPGTFYDRNQKGERRLYVHEEIVPGIAYALGVWQARQGATLPFGFNLPTTFFPLLMWLASLTVAILAVHRLVVHHLQRLESEMRRFGTDRRVPGKLFDASRPYEMQQLENAFQSMAYDLLNDEARMEDALREKNVLLKEVHHRVKNNLQMISSIMNMTIRKSRSPETIAAIRRLQERVLGLATVHRSLYQTDDLSKTNAGALLREIFTQRLSAHKTPGAPKVRVNMDLDEIIMFPDQAVPFSLLASEIATNALNNLGSPEGEEPWISFEFKSETPGVARLKSCNSTGPRNYRGDASKDHGLGVQLIKAFSMQLSATYEVEEKPGEYCVTVGFDVQDFKPEVQDY